MNIEDVGLKKELEETNEKFVFECREVEIGILFLLQKDAYSNIPDKELHDLLEAHTSNISWEYRHARKMKRKSSASHTAVFFPVRAGNTYQSFDKTEAALQHIKQEMESKDDIYRPQLERMVQTVKYQVASADPTLPSCLKDVEIFFNCSIGAAPKDSSDVHT